MIEAAKGAHGLVQRILARMAEGRVPQVMGQSERLRQVLIQAEHAADRAGNLRGFEAVGQARPEIVALVVDENLGLVLQPAEGRAMDDPVAIALEGATGRALGLGMQAAATPLRLTGIGHGRHGGSHNPPIVARQSRVGRARNRARLT